MLATLRRAFGVVLFPLLAAAYPILAVYAVNLREMVPLEAMVTPLLVALAATTLVMMLLRLAFGDWYRAGGVGVILVALFFTYGSAWEIAADRLPGGHLALLAAWAALALAGVMLVRAIGADRLRAATPALNVVLAALLVGNAVAIARFHLSIEGDIRPSRAEVAEAEPEPSPVEDLPDIYWLILDRYGSEAVVREYYDHDISPFLDRLRERGFYVAGEATANYLKTVPSILAARNMEYLDGEELRSRATAGDDWSPMYRDAAASFRVLEVLRSQGYRFVYIGTHWDVVASHPEADFNYIWGGPRDEFASVLGDGSLLRATELLGDAGSLSSRRQYWLRTRFQWESLHDSIRIGGPKFVHAHIGLPHDPYIFEPDGSFVTPDVARSRTRAENYANQVEYANASVIEFVDELLAADPDNPPIIIVQSEEGPFPERFAADQGAYRWVDGSTDEELHEKFGVLSTFYLPGLPGERAEEAGLYPSITMVNEFRVILNHYFGTDYDLLPDRNYVWNRSADVYQFVDLTERVRAMVDATE